MNNLDNNVNHNIRTAETPQFKRLLLADIDALVGLPRSPKQVLKRLALGSKLAPKGRQDPYMAADSKWLAGPLGISKKTVDRSLMYLRHNGLVVSWKRTKKGGGRISSLHFLQRARIEDMSLNRTELRKYTPATRSTHALRKQRVKPA